MAGRCFTVVLVGLLVALGGTGCGGEDLPDNARLVAAFDEGRTGIWVSGHGTVTQVLADESLAIGLPRQRFNVQIADSLSVIVYHSSSEGRRVPAQRGDMVAFQGRYEWNARGGEVTRTHADHAQAGGGGWIRHEGQTYK
ncbi:DUF3465 domain-containing protein [Wenzhouxiangella sp. AB-CW3]|uniref:DUF3465 domain-containing protein n=1 Tax=Wenzhouxiangella sp. AB-CW3 TaxID=2771012 RepID=UPI00168A8481|nr:DUF3465 domain-containing protein [Wenzhouxiangella sp. AB-CW3]QOC22685.1 DUF3465 domain-containing protein [Wenzhouxiangella sp. AB-CW3]